MGVAFNLNRGKVRAKRGLKQGAPVLTGGERGQSLPWRDLVTTVGPRRRSPWHSSRVGMVFCLDYALVKINFGGGPHPGN
jgi:hypothetical protein